MAEKSTIVPLREKDHTPSLILHRTLGKLNDIAEVIVIMHWSGERGWGCDWSNIKLADMAMAHAVLGHHLGKELDDVFVLSTTPNLGPQPGPSDESGRDTDNETGAASKGSKTRLSDRTHGPDDPDHDPDPAPRHPGGSAA